MLCRIDMRSTPRQVRFPFQICEFGTVSSFPQQDNHLGYKDKLEITLRIASGADVSIDQIDGATYSTQFPNMMTKLPGMTHHFSVENSRDAFYFCYARELVPAIRRMNLLPQAPVRPVELSPAVNLLVRQIMDFVPHTQEYGIADRIDLLCFSLLEELRLQVRDPRIDQSGEKILRLASYLRIHFCEDLDLDELAEQFGFSRRTLFRQWAKHFDVPPAQYILNLKIEEAKRLLRETQTDIATLSMKLNFNEVAYFCTFFKKHTGMAPNGYRKYLAAAEMGAGLARKAPGDILK